MKNQILKVTSPMYERILLTDDKLYRAISTYKTKEAIEEKAKESGKLSGIKTLELADINKIQLNESDKTTTLFYNNTAGKEKKLNLNFNDEEQSNDFGNYLGGELKMRQDMRDEKKLPKLIGNGILFIFCLGLFIYLINPSNFDSFLLEESSNTRSGRKFGFLQMIFDIIGHKGTLAAVLLMSGVTGWNAYTEYKNPAKVMTYTRV